MKKTLLIVCLWIVWAKIAMAQIAVPYNNQFDNIGDTAGWSHYALSGTDDWELGVPFGQYITAPLSSPNAWVTNLNGNFSANSVMCLQSPSFDLSGTSEYVLTFAHKMTAYSYHGGNVEYSIDGGQNWVLLNGNANEKKDWYPTTIPIFNQPGWNYSFMNFKFSSHSLGFLSGQADVRFRFKFGGTTNPQEGWLIDNFSIVPNLPNVVALNGNRFEVSKVFPTFDVVSHLFYQGILTPLYHNTTEYYFSNDSILDPLDLLLGTKTGNVAGTVTNFSMTFAMPPNLSSGDYYIFYKHDAANNLIETSENDNIAYCILHIDSTFVPGYLEDFESVKNYWKPYSQLTQTSAPLANNFWEKGYNDFYKTYGAHSGANSWYINQHTSYGASNVSHLFESPYLDFSTDSNNVICFWYKRHSSDIVAGTLRLELSRAPLMPEFWQFGINSQHQPIPFTRFNDWDCRCHDLSFLDGGNNNKLRFSFESQISSNSYAPRMVIDDIYIGPPKPDLSTEHTNKRTIDKLSTTDTLYYTLMNSGLSPAPPSLSRFYWSNDSTLDANDVLLGQITEPAIPDTSYLFQKFGFTVPNVALGSYYIIVTVDSDSLINEIWESNNSSAFPVLLTENQQVPYFNDFETHTDQWYHYSIIGTDDWAWDTPQGTTLQHSFSGQKSFITQPAGIASSKSAMILNTPVFELSTLNNPVLEFDMLLENYYNYNFSPRTNMSYSIDNGATWQVLDTVNQSFKGWYYPIKNNLFGQDLIDGYYYSNIHFAPEEKSFFGLHDYQGRDAWKIYRHIIDISHLKQYARVQFRFNFVTRINNPSEGALIDNFTIREGISDLSVNYKKELMISSLSEQLRFFMNISNLGNLITNQSIARFYVSSDTLLDASDYLIGHDTIPPIRPENDFHLNTMHNLPVNLSAYKYLLYELDANNSNMESNETNNTGYWPLALDSVSNFPYFMDFNDTIINGWTQFTYNYYGFHIKDRFRFRNQLVINEHSYSSGTNSGEMFTEMFYSVMYLSQIPIYYLETPSFNFENIDSIPMSFDLFWTGRQPGTATSEGDGGNMEYSTDGGNSWSLLTSQLGQATEWYNSYHPLSFLNYENGWSGYSPVFKPVTFDLSFLKGHKHVNLRFKYRSNYWPGSTYPVGFRIDNFKIDGFSPDYVAIDAMLPVSVDASNPSFVLNYKITNTGQTDGRLTKTKFYWSPDPVFDNNDILLTSAVEFPIAKGSTLSSNIMIFYPLPLAQTEYYIFYVADADSNLIELNELNNIGSYKVVLQLEPNYVAGNEFDNIILDLNQATINISYAITNKGYNNGTASSTDFYWSLDSIFDSSDQLLLSVNENPISSGFTSTSTVSINYPTPVVQTKYFIFYKADAGNTINETNENDNIGSFRVSLVLPDYIASNNFDTVTASISQPSFSVQYSIYNSGTANGASSTTAFFWSTDNILDAGDQLMALKVESPINIGNSSNSTIAINYPTQSGPGLYHLFYHCDYLNELWEINENDNIGSFKVTLTSDVSVTNNSHALISMFSNGRNIFVEISDNSESGSYALQISNLLGQAVYKVTLNLSEGLNAHPMPVGIASGAYVISINNNSNFLMKKVLISN